jgi:histidinol-phosphatase (PHP family)
MESNIMYSNYHCHSSFSDGTGSPEDIVLEAIRLGMRSIGISEHAPLPFVTSWNMPLSRTAEYFENIQNLKFKYKNQIEIYCGLEIDYINEIYNQINQLVKFYNIDYIIGSIHFLGIKNNGEFWNTDGDAEEFNDGAEQIFENNGEKMVESYFDAVTEMINLLKPTIIGHIDKFRMHNLGNKFFDEDSIYYKNAAIEALRTAKRNNCIIEFNTRGLYKHSGQITYPSEWMLKQMQLNKIPVTVNSDSHNPNEITKEFNTAFSLLKRTGYSTHFQLQNNIWTEMPIT